MQTTYTPGRWYLLALRGVYVALAPDSANDLVRTLWERMRSEPTFPAILDVLTSHVGGAVSSLPSFAALIIEGDGVRVAVRGAVDAEISERPDTEPQRFSGTEVTTWSERFVGAASAVRLSMHSGYEAGDLPLEGGVVRAGSVSVALAGESRVPAPVEPASLARVPHMPGAAEPAPDSLAPAEPAAESVPASSETTVLPTDTTLAPSATEIDEVWESTIMSSRRAAAAVEKPQDAGEALGDHDGATVSLAELRARRGGLPEPAYEAAPATGDGEVASGRVRLSTGQVIELDRTVIIGRRPRSSRVGGADLPLLIAVDSPQQDISRSHLEIRIDGDTVVVVDLHTTNGSTLLRPATDPVRLHPGEATLVLSGDVVDMGDGVTATFEDLP
ncbi:FHA domain-containing protein [Microbacterium koreense]|uniref:FHA domain-containing protein n=1 Tax=Microbacterium koreense TaxID=323761 RepID=A0ABW2ZRC9_9MICO